LLFGSGFDAFGANFFPLTVNLFALQINGESSAGFDVGVADFVSGHGTSPANITSSTHRLRNTN